ncbi:protocatechuate 4,5-dioxygenase alpha subunit /protocatechuate 4,5-dioxygenase beta subunit [Sphaerotilus hippei]|uniref:Protocatechuate 4,5-dioxygenase alpha subunit /protocatechuate 4,5-dioxygenase beta subunit n=1 Tax=Sphaerotilus hippei TaxID=744406 RepID=A0A318H2S8_9BURK|nr:gallate dioxygenase [Sphaerotilus hippei]PXW97630.1 protocatechuate 4,5-dioxygenase alpha subunit /protocatechuate 4,5-dioxygenase beta subunit [Sphaerotilus hippei]
MATIIGGVAVSHTPTIGFAFDQKKHDDPVWAPIFAAFEPVKQWLAERKPDVAIVTYNDHVTSFFFDHYSAFALGIGERYESADEGGGARDLPAVQGHPGLAAHIGQSLVCDEFDMSFFQGKPLDHGAFSPMSVLWEHEAGWPVRIVPLQMGVLQFPVPSARRFWKLGQALRRAIESYPEDLRVVIVATGGLSHQVHGERAGFNNTPWDMQFLELFEKDPERLASLTHAELVELGGAEGAEVMMWLTMRGALSSQVKKVHQAYYLPSMTGIAAAVYENQAGPVIAGEVERHRQAMATQLAGAERLQGTYPFNFERSVKAFRLNRFLHDLIEPARREHFLTDEAACMREADLTDEERELVRRRDWRGLIHYGVIFFMLEKLGAVVGVSNLHIYAAMRGQTLEDFQKTRNAPGALYSVAGKDAGKLDWNAQPAGPAA